MKNYYEELEISKTASKEVIEKVYKVLAKKYHPDTTQETDKQAAEEKFKIISEAYEILSDDEKRKKYDLELEQSNPSVSYEDYINIVNERNSLNNMNTQNYDTNQQYVNNQTYSHSNSKKPKYYYKDTGKPASAFQYYKYRIKKFFENLGFIILIIIAIISIISRFIGIDLFNLFL